MNLALQRSQLAGSAPDPRLCGVVGRVIVAVARSRGLTVGEIIGSKRRHSLVAARRDIFWLAAALSPLSLKQISQRLGKDNATMHHHLKALTREGLPRPRAMTRRQCPRVARDPAIVALAMAWLASLELGGVAADAPGDGFGRRAG